MLVDQAVREVALAVQQEGPSLRQQAEVVQAELEVVAPGARPPLELELSLVVQELRQAAVREEACRRTCWQSCSASPYCRTCFGFCCLTSWRASSLGSACACGLDLRLRSHSCRASSWDRPLASPSHGPGGYLGASRALCLGHDDGCSLDHGLGPCCPDRGPSHDPYRGTSPCLCGPAPFRDPCPSLCLCPSRSPSLSPCLSGPCHGLFLVASPSPCYPPCRPPCRQSRLYPA
mmetsp:Transcript_4105/g.8853  ORF Transcript_4105/g.8853 Transcript_4105/m.8853 type:complete len:233 (+) Transcript_4105:2702-3400(+)